MPSLEQFPPLEPEIGSEQSALEQNLGEIMEKELAIQRELYSAEDRVKDLKKELEELHTQEERIRISMKIKEH